MNKILAILLFNIFLMSACDDVVYTPKPRAYPKIDYPVKAYQVFDEDYCKFTFEYPQYAKIQQDTLFFDERPEDPCWFDIFLPSFDARIHCSYFPIGEENTFDQLNHDAFELADKHNLKADYIEDFIIKKPNRVSGIAFNLKGAVASPFQFILTDSTKHFLRGSLYFNTKARPDSLAPVVDFVKKDIMQMINTFEWAD